MSKYKLPILTNKSSSKLDEFINFWSQLYKYDNSELYNVIHNKTLTELDLVKLYTWKNAMNLAATKRKSLDTKIISKLAMINKLRNSKEIDIEVFLVDFKNVSFVWKIFLLHIIKPNIYPIYDQHVHRCYLYIQNNDYSNIKPTMNDQKKINFYFNEYLPFVQGLKINNLKKMDEAFFAFGQFLNINNQKKLFS